MPNYDPTAALAELLAPKNARAQELSELSFHQGIVTSWDSETGENTVTIAGAPIVDVPMLNIGDTTNILVDDTVAVLRYRNAYFIIGRIVIPGTGGFASSSFAYETFYDFNDNFVVPAGTPTTVVSSSGTIPVWANFGIASLRIDFAGYNQTGARDSIYSQVDVNGSFNSPELISDVENNRVAYVGTSYAPSITFTSPGTWSINGQVRTSNNAFVASTFNTALVSGSVMYFRR